MNGDTGLGAWTKYVNFTADGARSAHIVSTTRPRRRRYKVGLFLCVGDPTSKLGFSFYGEPCDRVSSA